MEIINILSACLTPVVAVTGIYLGVKNYTLALKKRKDDLFDRRYAFLRDFEKLWKATGLESEGATRAVLDWDDIEPFAQKASYLFGEDIAEHLRSYDGKSCDRSFSWIPDSALAKPFEKYLKL